MRRILQSSERVFDPFTSEFENCFKFSFERSIKWIFIFANEFDNSFSVTVFKTYASIGISPELDH